MKVSLLYQTGKIYLALFFKKREQIRIQVNTADFRRVWFLGLFEVGQIIKIYLSTINGRKRCSEKYSLLSTICVALN